MKFFLNFLLFTILDTRGELGDGQETSTGLGESYEKYLSDDNLAELESTVDETGAETADGGQNEESEDGQADEATEETPESILDAQDGNSETEGDENDILGSINDLGFVHNGLPFEIESMEQLKELVQKGHDYTLKTQGLSDERKSFDTEMQSLKEEFEQEKASFKEEMSSQQDALYNFQVLSNVLGQLQNQDPELFQEIDQLFVQESSRFGQRQNNPEFSKVQGELKEIKEQLASRDKEAETKQDESIRKEWETGLQETQTAHAKRLRQLGVKVDWKKVQDAWKADSTGKMTVKSAMLSIYGDNIMKAAEAQRKLLVARKQPKSEPVLGESKGSEQEQTASSGSYLNKLQDLAKKYAG